MNRIRTWLEWYRRQRSYTTLPWSEKYLGGHITLMRTPIDVTLYGENAMHWALEVGLPTTYFVARPTTRSNGHVWRWYAYLSPDATPRNRTWGVGPGLDGR